MKVRPIHSLLLFCAIGLSACQSGDKPPESAAEARERIVGKKWLVRDAGYLESSFREQKGEPFIHTVLWFSATKDLGTEDQATRDKFSKATLTLDENKNPNDGTGDIAHLDGLNFGAKQNYYFTGTQEENAYDRTIKLYVNCEDSTGAQMQYPFTILQASSKKMLLLAPLEIQSKGLVLSLETQ